MSRHSGQEMGFDDSDAKIRKKKGLGTAAKKWVFMIQMKEWIVVHFSLDIMSRMSALHASSDWRAYNSGKAL